MNFTDGMWHRLHPASPLLKGGFALIAILGVLFSNLRDRLVDMFLPHLPREGDPVDYIIDNGLLGYAALVVAAVLIVLIAAFYASWRMHTFRITEEVVEVRSGILFRTNRKARLDRIQGINIVRPFFARLFGAAKLEISQAGQDANVQLSYLTSAAADGLREEILRLASGARRREPGTTPTSAAPDAVGPASGIGARAFGEVFGLSLPSGGTPGESVVTINLGRLFGSLVLHSSTVFLVVFGIGVTVWVSMTGGFLALFFILPSAIGFAGFYVRRFTKSLNYTIASTPDGVRVGWGLLSTTSETLPPGRIHSVRVAQPLLWRPAGWWEISVNRASHSATRSAAGQSSATILPVGNLAEVKQVLALLLPDLSPDAAAGTARHGGGDPGIASQRVAALLHSGLTSLGGDDGFVNSPERAVWLRPFSWRRNGFAVARGSLLLRRGAIWRELIIVPQARLQSVSLRQGPLLRMLHLASVHLHTVSGPISATLGAIDREVAVDFFSDVARSAVVSASRDTSHRWRAGEAPV